MGFGTLFVGYFLLFNIPYFGMTDIIASTVMMLGLSKLQSVNKYFRLAYTISMVFAVYSLPELVFFALDLFKIYSPDGLTAYLRIGQCIISAVLTFFILRGIYSVSSEVGLEKVPGRAKFMSYFSIFTYALWIISSIPKMAELLGSAVAIIYLSAIVALFLAVALNLTLIYSCHMRICMPDEGKKK